jgi:hypothetical protein
MSQPMIGWCKALEAIVPQSENTSWAGTCCDWEPKKAGARIRCTNCTKFKKFKEVMT